MFLLGLAVVGVMEHFTVMGRMRAHERSIRNNRSNYSKLVGTFVGARQKESGCPFRTTSVPAIKKDLAFLLSP